MNFTQIKMIICDMDGTLLDNQKNLPPHFKQIYKELYDRNIIFAISSGRQMGEVRKYFKGSELPRLNTPYLKSRLLGCLRIRLRRLIFKSPPIARQSLFL